MGSWYTCKEIEMPQAEKARWALFCQKCKKGTTISGLFAHPDCSMGVKYEYFSRDTMEQLKAVLEKVAPRRRFRLVQGKTLEQYHCIYGGGGKKIGEIQLWDLEIEAYPF